MSDIAPKPFQLLAEHVVLDLVNTLDFRFRASGPEELLGTYADLLRFLEQDGVKGLRETLADIFYRRVEGASPSAASLEKLEGYLRDEERQRKLKWVGDRAEWAWSHAEDDVRIPLWLMEEAARRLDRRWEAAP